MPDPESKHFARISVSLFSLYRFSFMASKWMATMTLALYLKYMSLETDDLRKVMNSQLDHMIELTTTLLKYIGNRCMLHKFFCVWSAFQYLISTFEPSVVPTGPHPSEEDIDFVGFILGMMGSGAPTDVPKRSLVALLTCPYFKTLEDDLECGIEFVRAMHPAASDASEQIQELLMLLIDAKKFLETERTGETFIVVDA